MTSKKEYAKALETQKTQYDLANANAYSAYRKQRLTIEAGFTEATTEAQKLLALEDVTLDVQPFELVFRDEINSQDLKSKLSKESLRTLAQLIGIVPEDTSNLDSDKVLQVGTTNIVLPSEYDTYSEVFSLINSKTEEYTKQVLANTDTTQEKLVSFGGALISTQSTTTYTEGAYILTTKSHVFDSGPSDYFGFGSTLILCDFDLTIDSSETVESIKVTAKNKSGKTFTDTPTYFPKTGNITSISSIFGGDFILNDFVDLTSFTADIYFKSGKQTQITVNKVSGFTTTERITGVFTFETPTPKTEQPFTYEVCTSPASGGKYNVELSLGMPSSNLDIVNVLYTLVNSNSRNTNGYYVKSRNGNTIILSGLFNTALTASQFESGSYIEFSLKLNTGDTVNFNTQPLTLNGCISGNFKVDVATPTNPTTGSSTSTPAETSFIPKGFGIKRLGIADYLKVEQTLHSYVPGEVSHIENILAREYKEKSTRRLRRSEVTDTTSTETEREKLTDTTTASRFEMQSEISKMLQESTDLGANANFHYGTGKSFSIDLGANYAHHKAKEESQRQAVTQSQDITSRALDRVVSKVKEERIEKIIEEYEENNKHGFDNTKGDKHVVGVYRWIDKRMKNQIFNYGKRMMFEFMIPEPASLHTIALKNLDKNNAKFIAIPEDPRTSTNFPLKDYTAVATTATLNHWLSVYNVDFEKCPEDEISVGKALKLNSSKLSNNADHDKYYAGSDKITIPEGYYASSARSNANMMYHMGSNEYAQMINTVGEVSVSFLLPSDRKDITATAYKNHILDKKYYNEIPISSMVYDGEYESVSSFTIICKLSPETFTAWQQKTFNAIISAYEEAKAEYDSLVAEEDAKAKQMSEENPTYYRQIEQEILKHNCIAYLTDDEFEKNERLGLDLNIGDTMESYFVNRDNLDQYSALVKFMEQAFEWNIMSYNFYPYYWGGRKEWESMHLASSVDPLFKSFLQSGMARVIITVKPGFEDAVQFYMTTGKIWNGGDVPVIGDPMYLSIVDELRSPLGEKQGKFWITQLPTTLTMLQADSLGLQVETALPYHEVDANDCENPEMIVSKEELEIKKVDYQLGGILKTGNISGTFYNYDDKSLRVEVKNLAGEVVDATFSTAQGNWEIDALPVGKYELLLDAKNQMEDTAITDGEKKQMIEVLENRNLEFDLTYQA